jgi:hypothetical protein
MAGVIQIGQGLQREARYGLEDAANLEEKRNLMERRASMERAGNIATLAGTAIGAGTRMARSSPAAAAPNVNTGQRGSTNTPYVDVASGKTVDPATGDVAGAPASAPRQTAQQDWSGKTAGNNFAAQIGGAVGLLGGGVLF